MREIKCPNCGNVFAVDESGYAQIVQQVRDKEFEEELKQRKLVLEQAKEKDLEIISMKQKQEFKQSLALKEEELSEKKQEIEQLKAQISESENIKKLAISEMVNKKEKEREDAIGQKNDEIADKDRIIEQLKAQISESENIKRLAISETINKKEREREGAIAQKNEELADRDRIIEQLRVQISESENIKRLAISETINKKEREREGAIAQKNEELADRDRIIEQLRAQISESENLKKLAVSEVIHEKEKERERAIKEKDNELADKEKEIKKKTEEITELKEKVLNKNSETIREIEQLKAQISGKEAEKRLAVSEAIKMKEVEVSERLTEIEALKGQLSNKETENQLKEQSLRREYEEKLKLKDEQIEYYKDFKARQSTKMVGESLEQHCLNQFNALRMTAFPAAYFEKDNDVRKGSKGDFIFRESKDGIEFISIMFEMKNEMDETATKHKNEDFFKELDKDRREKGCEYAVLVSLLEIDNDLYNNGIVDVSYKYEKMYVIRPQFFIPMITLLRNAALNSMKYRQELEVAKHQQIDILHFEENMNAFKEGFSRNYRIASDRFNTAIEEIDKTILHLQKTKKALLSSENNLRLANKKAEDLNIKKLTRDAPAVKEMFDEIKRENSDNK